MKKQSDSFDYQIQHIKNNNNAKPARQSEVAIYYVND